MLISHPAMVIREEVPGKEPRNVLTSSLIRELLEKVIPKERILKVLTDLDDLGIALLGNSIICSFELKELKFPLREV